MLVGKGVLGGVEGFGHLSIEGGGLLQLLFHTLVGSGGSSGGINGGVGLSLSGTVAEIVVEHFRLPSDVGADSGDASCVFVVDVVEAETAVGCQVLIELIGRSELEAEDVLLSLDVAAHTIAGGGGAEAEVEAILLLIGAVGGLEKGGNHGNGALEGTQSVAVGAFAAAADEGETGLETPFVVVESGLYRWQYRNGGLALEGLDTICITSVEGERVVEWCALEDGYRHPALDGACLVDILNVE